MKCVNHIERDAIAICVNCGKALCADCAKIINNKKISCSDNCQIAIEKFEKVIDIIYEKTLKQNTVSGYGCFAMGTIFVLFGTFNLLIGKSLLPLGIFLAATGISFYVWGIRYKKIGQKQNHKNS